MFKDYERFLKKTIEKVFAVFLVFKISDVMLMKSIRQQIIEAKREKTEREKEMWFVDYCNNCKTGLAFKNDVPAIIHIIVGMKVNRLLFKQALLE